MIKALKQFEQEKVLSFINEDLAKYTDYLKKFENKMGSSGLDNLSYQNEINQRTFQIVKSGDALSAQLPKVFLDELKDYFRKAILPWMGQSQIMKRALEKPRGYPGDYQMLEYIYNNVAISQGIGHYFDKGFLDSELTVAVRNRKDLMSNYLLKYLTEDKKNINVLNLACGSCREIREIIDSIPNYTRFTCLDMDNESLSFSSAVLDGLNAKFVKGDVIKIAIKSDPSLFGKPNIIYSIGLIDYLPDRILSKLISLCYKTLSNGGKLILSHKDRTKYAPIKEDWLTDWKFIPRTYEQTAALLNKSGIPSKNVEHVYEPSGIIFFMIVSKK